MKNLSLSVLIISSVLSISSVAFAGKETGNGGGGFICLDSTQSEFLDLYEGRLNLNLNIPISNAEVEDQIQNAFKRLRYDEDFYRLVLFYYAQVRSANVIPLPANTDLAWPSDEENRYAKKGCNGVGIMVFYDQTHSMDQDTSALNSLPKTQQAAAWVHETIYKFLRATQNDLNATRTQKVVAHLFSDESEQDLQVAIHELKILRDHDFGAGPSFRLDTSLPALGLAFRDQTGLVWGDMVLNTNDSTPEKMVQSDAEKYCSSIGARLPTEKDLRQLGKDLNSDFFEHTFDLNRKVSFSDDTPDADIMYLPNLELATVSPKGKTYQTTDYWSSNRSNNEGSILRISYGPNTLAGDNEHTIFITKSSIQDTNAVRCVVSGKKSNVGMPAQMFF